MVTLGLLPADQDEPVRKEIQEVGNAISSWFGRLYQNEIFDFQVHSGFIAEGKAAMSRFHHLRRHVQVNPEFIFLDRTRYGLLRLFEQMGARVCFRNPFEW